MDMLSKFSSSDFHPSEGFGTFLGDFKVGKERMGTPPFFEDNWENWLTHMFPNHVSGGFAPHHRRLWLWVWSLRPNVRPRPLMCIWPRGGGKSTSAELAAAMVGCLGVRRYCLYVRHTQDLADESVVNISRLLESDRMIQYYPLTADREVSKFGHSRGWRRQGLRTASGFKIDGIGLDSSVRGAKVDSDRPDIIIFDDVDGKHDSPLKTEKKISTLTTSIIPAGSPDVAILGIQNLIHRNGIFARVANGDADFLRRRVLIGPIPAVEDLEFDFDPELKEYVITNGTPTWSGQSIATCEDQMNDWGPRSFLIEAQHQVSVSEDALWKQENIDETRVFEYPELEVIVVGVDPAADSDSGAEHGILVVGAVGVRSDDPQVYVLEDFTIAGKPKQWGSRVVGAYEKYEANEVIAEKNNGGDMVSHVIHSMRDENDENIGSRIPVRLVWASRSKQLRAEPIQLLYSQNRVHHVGFFPQLEEQMVSWVPGSVSPDRLDALVWAIWALNIDTGDRKKKARARTRQIPHRVSRGIR